MRATLNTFKGTIFALLLMLPVPGRLLAASLEFRSDGFFASPDTRVEEALVEAVILDPELDRKFLCEPRVCPASASAGCRRRTRTLKRFPNCRWPEAEFALWSEGKLIDGRRKR
jgi:hypothetical protein